MGINNLNSLKCPNSNYSSALNAQNNNFASSPKLKTLDHDEVSFSKSAKPENIQERNNQIQNFLNVIRNYCSNNQDGGAKIEQTQEKSNQSKRIATDNEKEELKKSAKELGIIYKKNIKKIKEDYIQKFGNLESAVIITARAKDADSIEPKLLKKFESGKLNSTDRDACAKVIGDGYGTRIQLKSLSKEESKEIITNALKDSDKTYEDFVNALNSNEDISADLDYQTALDNLKEAQTNEFVEDLCNKIENKEIELADDEFNNYGDNLSSYFSNRQLMDIGLAYCKVTGKPLNFVNSTDLMKNDKVVKIIGENPDKKIFNKITDKQKKKAVKESGYTSAQMNVMGNLTNGETLSDTEFQVRGVEVNKFADVEHIPYDIRTGKIKSDDPKYKDVYGTIASLSKESYKEYNNYLTDTYHHLRMEELGIPSPVPQIPSLKYADENTLQEIGQNDMINKADKKLTDEELYKLTPEGLSKYAHTKDKKQE